MTQQTPQAARLLPSMRLRDERRQPVAEAQAEDEEDREDIVDKGGRGQRIGMVLPHHDVVGKADQDKADLP